MVLGSNISSGSSSGPPYSNTWTTLTPISINESFSEGRNWSPVSNRFSPGHFGYAPPRLHFDSYEMDSYIFNFIKDIMILIQRLQATKGSRYRNFTTELESENEKLLTLYKRYQDDLNAAPLQVFQDLIRNEVNLCYNLAETIVKNQEFFNSLHESDQKNLGSEPMDELDAIVEAAEYCDEFGGEIIHAIALIMEANK